MEEVSTFEAKADLISGDRQEDGIPLSFTGENRTIYQIAGKNDEGQTILIAHGADGEPQPFVGQLIYR